MIEGRLLVVFDGLCRFCNASVRWLIRRDRRNRLRFVAFESEKAAGVLKRHGVERRNATGVSGTILVVRDFEGSGENLLARSDAAVALLRELPRPWPGVGMVLRWIPRPLRDSGYELVARWRYRIRGRLESCPVPTADERERFL